MMRKYSLPLAALIGLMIAVIAVFNSNRSISGTPPVTQPAAAPFPVFVAGAGIVEASSGDIAVGSPAPGIITSIYVDVGARVNAGDRLFKIDDRDLQAQLPVATAKVAEVTAALEKLRHTLDFNENVAKQQAGAISVQDLSTARDNVKVGQASLDLAKAQLEQIKQDIDRRTIRAPVSGKIIQRKARVGEYTAGGDVRGAPIMMLGSDAERFVRVDVDENDAWRVRPGAKAMAFMRGNPKIKTALHFEYIEPYFVPKTSLTGRSTERTDTRVMQVLYSFRRDMFPADLGQQVDVFIEAAPADGQVAGRKP